MVKDVIWAAAQAAASFFRPGCPPAVKEFRNTLGGFCSGVCHPLDDRLEDLRELHVKWVRFDITVRPLDDAGQETAGYIAFKKRAALYRDAGFQVMAITPYPASYSAAPYDPAAPEFRERLIADIRYLAKDLQGLVAAFQISNEHQVPHFRFPLTEKQSMDFIGIQLEALETVKGNIKVGFNLQDFSMFSYLQKMKPYLRFCDYIGLDLYLGCFESMTKNLSLYDLVTRCLWNFTGKPVWVAEFGYIGAGSAKTEAEKREILRAYGVGSEAEARVQIRAFLDRLPDGLRGHILKRAEHGTDEDLAWQLFSTDQRNHLYREIPADVRLRRYDHTPEDQARFMTDTVRRLRKLPFVCGAMVYCYSDTPYCHHCGMADCPIETSWGLVDVNGKRKPAWYAVRDAFAGLSHEKGR